MKPNDKDQRLKLAVQKSGRLTDPSLDLLKNCGLKLSRGRDQLMGFGENMPLDVLFLRDDDIPDLVQEDVADLGLVGRNVLEEKRLELIARGHPPSFTELRTLDYGRCRLSLAIRWILMAIREKKGRATAQKLADELVAAYNREGTAMARRENVHRMADANKAFAHFGW